MDVCVGRRGVGVIIKHPLPWTVRVSMVKLRVLYGNSYIPVIKDGGLSAQNGSDDNDGLFSPCGSFPWQWVNEFLLKRGALRIEGYSMHMEPFFLFLFEGDFDLHL